MSTPASPPNPAAGPSHDDLMAAQFANLVLQHTQLGLMLTGKTPRPDTGQSERDLDQAQFVIDQLEMLEAKTRGNLTPDEDRLLKQSLMTLRLAYVEAVDRTPAPAQPTAAPANPPAPAASGETPPPAPAAAEEESRKKFSKKY